MDGKPAIWAVVNYKGGVGKSTVSVHLACHLGAEIIDLDAQGDAARFGDAAGLPTHRMHGATPEQLFDLVETLRAQGKRVVMDGSPGESALTGLAILVSDVVVTPTRPGPNDLEALSRIAVALREANRIRVQQDGPDAAVPLLLLCNFYRRSSVADVFVSTLQAVGVGRYIGKLWERNDYAFAIADGKPVWEFAPDSQAAKEMRSLVVFLEKMALRRGREARV
jgi:chromosome partitioning protein